MDIIDILNIIENPVNEILEIPADIYDGHLD